METAQLTIEEFRLAGVSEGLDAEGGEFFPQSLGPEGVEFYRKVLRRKGELSRKVPAADVGTLPRRSCKHARMKNGAKPKDRTIRHGLTLIALAF